MMDGSGACIDILLVGGLLSRRDELQANEK
jgi:hypothetical protein